MTGRLQPVSGLVSQKGEAAPPPEPTAAARRRPAGRRVSATLPQELYVAFKTHVAGSGLSGEQVILAAIRRALEEG